MLNHAMLEELGEESGGLITITGNSKNLLLKNLK